MECQVCKSKTKINWGNSDIVLCEAHSNELSRLQNENQLPSKNKTNVVEIVSKILLIVVCWFLAVVTLPFVALSAMAFDSGFSWAGVIIVGIISLIPISLIVTPVYVLLKK